MKILITGAGGMLGSDLAMQFASHFKTLGAGVTSAHHLKIPYSLCDLSNPDDAKRAIEKEKPTFVFHTAAYTDVDACQLRRHDALKHNLEATKNVVACCSRSGSILVFFSTDYVFDGTKTGEYEEGDKPNPLNTYGETKYLAEQFVRLHAERYVIFRLSWLYGFHGKSFPRTILERAQQVSKFSVVSDQVGRPTYTKDIAVAFKELLLRNPAAFDHALNDTFHLGGDSIVNWADFARGILNAAGIKNIPVESITTEQSGRPAPRPKNSVLSLVKTRQKLGLRARAWETAIPEFLEEIRTAAVVPSDGSRV